MVVIRLARGGSHKRPFYHVVATDSRNRRDGRFIERVGFFNPVARGADIRLNLSVDRIDYWRSHGAQVSPRVSELLKDFSAQASKGA
ncbi:MAG: 30S ribosomal protein S16 [Betaproteobacteria bacterium]|nr:30S ribosomal protein S16 [Betaproteobacteria bacterium]NBT74570.1 30S ribosomal protein S16 [Betaproteobacteria bacterium]NBY13709.1 30S ribosomal protein S16 [Betaproteobacteria bacterium]NCA16284.1 30S ribosomal protein S16 [Betaproteobacteria bacterium]